MTPITRRNFIGTSLGAFAGAALQQGATAAQPSPKADGQPNILFIMTDQQRGDSLGCDGNTAIHTPNLDRIAAEGTHFKHAYSSTPSCTPARAALLTGMDPWNHGMLGYYKVGDKYPIEMPQALRDAGYYTLGIGKNHWHPQRHLHGFHNCILDESGRVQDPEFKSDYRAWFSSVAPHLDPDETGIGWNEYRASEYKLPEELHPTFWTAEVAKNFIQNYRQDNPFFLKVSFARPHSPYDPPQRWMDFYKDADIPKRALGDWCDRYAKRSDKSYNIWHGDLGEEQARHSRQGYYGSVSFIDEQIGSILETLEARGLTENTLIIFCSDHGDMLGDHHMWRKTYAYEASARVPMLVRWPKSMGITAQRGQALDAPVEIRDILPTCLDAAGARDAKNADKITGMSMLDLIRGKAKARPFIDLEHDVCYSKKNHWSSVTDGKTKYVFHAMDGEEQLFDLTQDPHETKDLAGHTQHTKTLQQWRSNLVSYLEPRGGDWVTNNRPALRPDSILRSPNFPGLAET